MDEVTKNNLHDLVCEIRGQFFFLGFQIVAKRAPEARSNGNVGKKKKKLKMSCRQKNKKKGKKPGGIKVSDVAGKKMINHRISGDRTLFGPIGQGLLYRFSLNAK